ncbi:MULTISPECIES: F0F1 ATP synthase subunit B' [Mameliella]|jgi:F-type H+-transporting ATPase subunit b|uniref:F0F1 ATP synthase subunit B' n=1 Tax=Mameliella TaxID=1434019 RepID=UPI0008410281|nr:MULTISPECIES: F0F1 ATP synthase subunit B' [Mameliella]MBV6636364.1 F0F1 ATP synthase subunit B' [Mameliella sp.]MCR9271559.1 F0F1 ATP synthase subunit B' [Paracoccaceae bacterium]ODM48295.1 ATP F0F1 synthase subunit B' [Ruegeria sp. PBVC088]MBY6121346.1 F0F1 ATP synthase subunit B' [Mameliella alba]MDD9733612.1 F0F1 ATP synthase subunit B' [Mameliella sp. AT18]
MATETHGAEAVSTCVDSHGSAVGMPQLCGDWIGNQVFWLVITLVVIYFVLARIALPRIAAVLAERQGTITNDIAAAEDLKRKAEEAEAAYDKALADARAEAQVIAQKARDDIKADLDVAMEKADAEIAAKAAESEKAIAEIRDSALANVEVVAKDTAGAIVAALGASADDAKIAAAVDAQLKG